MSDMKERYTKMKKTMKKVRRKTITGRNAFTYRKARVAAAVCGNCGRELHGVPRLNKYLLAKLSKTEKRPNRKFGGYYCSNCTKELMRAAARKV